MKLGYKLQKENLDLKEYAKVAEWCNKNNLIIENKGEYYEVVEIPVNEEPITNEPSNEERIKALEEYVTMQMGEE